MSKKYDGLVRSDWAIRTTTSSGGELTLDLLDKYIQYLHSDEYHEAQTQAMQRAAGSRDFVVLAWEQGVITEVEAVLLHARINSDGYLLVDSDMAKRLEKVKI